MPVPRTSILAVFPPPATVRPSRTRAAAFSLVETALAVGVAAFALITIIGLQPVGLTTLRASMDATQETQILNHLSSEIGQTDFSRLESYEDLVFHFDADGQRVSSEAEARFQIRAAIIPPSPDFSPFPSAPSDIQTSLKTVRLEIRPVRPANAVAAPPTRVHVFHVARSDKLL